MSSNHFVVLYILVMFEFLKNEMIHFRINLFIYNMTSIAGVLINIQRNLQDIESKENKLLTITQFLFLSD